MNVIQLNTVNLGGDIVIKKCEGGSESGGSNWRYFDYSAATPEAKLILFGLSNLVAVRMYGQMCILPSTFGSSSDMTKGAICWDVPIIGPFNENEEMRQMSYGEMVEFMATANGVDFASIPEITKEQFYTLE